MLGDGQSMSSRSVQMSTARGSVLGTMSGSERAVASLSREKAGCEEWAALSEELADLQASPEEETRRLTELFRTGATLKRQPNLQERSSVSNVKTSQTRHWKRTRNSSCVPRSSLWRLLSQIAVRRSPILRRGWMRSASEEDAGSTTAGHEGHERCLWTRRWCVRRRSEREHDQKQKC